MISEVPKQDSEKTSKKSPEIISEDLRRCLKERAFFHKQFYLRLSNDPETRLKLEKLSNKSADHSQNSENNNNINAQCSNATNSKMKYVNSNENVHKTDYYSSTNTNNEIQPTLKPLKEPHGYLLNTDTTKRSIIENLQPPNQQILNQHVLYSKTGFNFIKNATINTNTNIKLNDVNVLEKSEKNNYDSHAENMLMSSKKNVTLPISQPLNSYEICKDNEIIKQNCRDQTNHNGNYKEFVMNDLPQKIINGEEIAGDTLKMALVSEDLFWINVDERVTLNSNSNNNLNTIKNNSDIVDCNTLKANEIKSSVLVANNKTTPALSSNDCSGISNSSNINVFYGSSDGNRETYINSDYSTSLPATTITRHQQNCLNKNNIEINSVNKCLNSLIENSLSSSSTISKFSLVKKSQQNDINTSTIDLNSSSSSDFLSLSCCDDDNDNDNVNNDDNNDNNDDKLSKFFLNKCKSKNSYNCIGSRCYTVNKDGNKFESTINSTDHQNKCSEQWDSSDGAQQKLNDNQGYLIKKRKRDKYRKFLKDQQKLEEINKRINRRNFNKENNLNQNTEYQFPCVDKLVKMYTKLLQQKKNEGQNDDAAVNPDKKLNDETTKRNNNLRLLEFQHHGSPVSDEGCQLGLSPYSSDYDDNEADGSHSIKEKVARSSSSDSAVGLDEDVSNLTLTDQSDSPNHASIQHNKCRRQTLTVTDIPLRTALLPVAEPTQLPESPTQDVTNILSNHLITQTAIPSKVLLEERVVEIPEDRYGSLSSSRRESAQSCLSDYNSSDYGGVRYVRTPSVVVSDYSDDVMCGITLEEIEYFRAHRMRRRSSADTAATEKEDACSDVSGTSSCSNLNYCGSTISALDGSECFVNGVRQKIIDRKISDCSLSSAISGEDEDDDFNIQDYQNQFNKNVCSNQNQLQMKDNDKKLARKQVGDD